MPKLSEMRPGDLICELYNDDHFMIWVGGTEALVENVDAGDFNGVFRHSDSKMRKAFAQRHEQKKGSDDDSDDEGENFAVFRCENAAIAGLAAEFAILWSTSKGDELFTQGKESGEEFTLKVPFSQDRLTAPRQQRPDQWDVRSLFRAIRVLARHTSSAPVSVKGWTCSSFATYCYQAATLALLFKGNAIPATMLQVIRRTDSTDFLSIKSDLSLIELALGESTELVRRLIPPGLLVDGKSISATSLKVALAKPDNGFAKLGDITGA